MEKLFPSANEILHHEEVVQFTFGLLDNPDPFIDNMCNKVSSICYDERSFLFLRSVSTESSQSSLDHISESQPLEEPFQEDDIEKQLFSRPEVEEKPSPLPTLEDHATSSQPTHPDVTETNDDAFSLDTKKSVGISGSIVVDQPPVRCISSTDVNTPFYSLPTMQVLKPAERQVSTVTELSLTGDASLNSSGFTITFQTFNRSVTKQTHLFRWQRRQSFGPAKK